MSALAAVLLLQSLVHFMSLCFSCTPPYLAWSPSVSLISSPSSKAEAGAYPDLAVLLVLVSVLRWVLRPEVAGYCKDENVFFYTLEYWPQRFPPKRCILRSSVVST